MVEKEADLSTNIPIAREMDEDLNDSFGTGSGSDTETLIPNAADANDIRAESEELDLSNLDEVEDVARGSLAVSTDTENDEIPDSPLGIYFRDIVRIPLLTVEEEVALAKALETGKTAKNDLEELQKGESGVIDVQKIEQLQKQVNRGSEARTTLMESNLRLVVSVARRYLGRGLPFSDLIQEGSIGLSRAVDKFDYRRGFKFSTYSYWWIRQAVTRAIANQSRTIRVPVHMIDQIGGVYSILHDLQQQLGREPTHEEWAAAANLPIDKLGEALRAGKTAISLETPVGDEKDSTIADYIPDRKINLEKKGEESDFGDQLDAALEEGLSPREKRVLRLRFGLEDGRDHTLKEIGNELGVSRERIRQIEAEALAKMRKPALRNRLREYLE